MTHEERQKYATRLVRRIVAVVGQGRYPDQPDDWWESLIPAEEMLFDALDAWDRGDIDKAELDSKAIGYINTWRDGNVEAGARTGRAGASAGDREVSRHST